MKSRFRNLDTNWKIFVITHRNIIEEYFNKDHYFNPENFPIFNVSSTKLGIDKKYTLINQSKLPTFFSLGKHWAESEAIWNIWRAGLHKNLQFIGFTQYDKEIVTKKRISLFVPRQGITIPINNFTQDNERGHISLQRHLVIRDIKQRILADDSKPNTLTGKGKTAYERIISDYNDYFKESITKIDLLKKSFITLCSSFVIDIKTFESMMQFFDYVIRNSGLDKLDPERKFRLQGGLSERYFGVYLMMQNIPYLNLSTPHHNLKFIS